MSYAVAESKLAWVVIGLGVGACAASPPARLPRAAPVVATREEPAPSPKAAPGSCLDALQESGVAFLPLRYSRGVSLPVQIEGPIGGVSYRPTAGFDLVVDCRFALVLAGVGPILRRQGVSTLEFSIAHRYRLTRGGLLSLHANGLALDVHRAILDDGEELSVQHDFRRRLGTRGCDPERPMNLMACELKRTGWFSEFLTPDDNRDHSDHFHIGVARSSQSGTTLSPRASGKPTMRGVAFEPFKLARAITPVPPEPPSTK